MQQTGFNPEKIYACTVKVSFPKYSPSPRNMNTFRLILNPSTLGGGSSSDWIYDHTQPGNPLLASGVSSDQLKSKSPKLEKTLGQHMWRQVSGVMVFSVIYLPQLGYLKYWWYHQQYDGMGLVENRVYLQLCPFSGDGGENPVDYRHYCQTCFCLETLVYFVGKLMRCESLDCFL